jgi:hypothetical protein
MKTKLFNDDGGLTALRFDNWKLTAKESVSSCVSMKT